MLHTFHGCMYTHDIQNLRSILKAAFSQESIEAEWAEERSLPSHDSNRIAGTVANSSAQHKKSMFPTTFSLCEEQALGML